MENDFLIAGQTCFASLSQIGKFRFHSFECFPYGDRSKAPFNRFQVPACNSCSPPLQLLCIFREYNPSTWKDDCESSPDWNCLLL